GAGSLRQLCPRAPRAGLPAPARERFPVGLPPRPPGECPDPHLLGGRPVVPRTTVTTDVAALPGDQAGAPHLCFLHHALGRCADRALRDLPHPAPDGERHLSGGCFRHPLRATRERIPARVLVRDPVLRRVRRRGGLPPASRHLEWPGDRRGHPGDPTAPDERAGRGHRDHRLRGFPASASGGHLWTGGKCLSTTTTSRATRFATRRPPKDRSTSV